MGFPGGNPTIGEVVHGAAVASQANPPTPEGLPSPIINTAQLFEASKPQAA